MTIQTTPAHNAIVGFPSWRTKAVWSASTANVLFPAANLGTMPLSYPWRSTSPAPEDTVITATFSPRRRVDFVALCRHNLSIGSAVTVELLDTTTEPETVLASVTVQSWPAVFTEDQVDWDGGRWWDRTYTAEEIAGYPWHLPIRLPGAYYVDEVRIRPADPLNPMGFVQIGAIEVGEAHQILRSFSFGAEYGYQSRTESQEADGGTMTFRRRPKPRVFEGVISHLPRDSALGVWLEMRRQLDIDVPFFWWPNPEDPVHQLRNAYPARFTALSLQSFASPGRDGVPISLREVM